MEALATAASSPATRTQLIEQLAIGRLNINDVLSSIEKSLRCYEKDTLALPSDSSKCLSESPILRSENRGLHMQFASGSATADPVNGSETHRMRAGVQDDVEIMDVDADAHSYPNDLMRCPNEKVSSRSEGTGVQFVGDKTAVDRTSDIWCSKVERFAPEGLNACVVEPVWYPPHSPALEKTDLDIPKSRSVSANSRNMCTEENGFGKRPHQDKPPGKILARSHAARWRAIQEFSSGPKSVDCRDSLVAAPRSSNVTMDAPQRASKQNQRPSFWKGRLRSSDIARRQLPVFADAMAMKEKVREALAEKEYDVSDFYKTSGVAQMIARSIFFEYTSLLVILLNAIWISVEVDNNNEKLLIDADWQYQVAEHFFCLYFVIEWCIRFGAFELKQNTLSDAWFCFDTVLVAIMILETWVLSLVASSSGLSSVSVLKVIRLVRLTRISRVAKLVRRVPELVILFKGVYVAIRSVLFTFVLLMIIVYVVAVVMREITNDTEIGHRYFETVPDSMISLLLEGVLPDQARWIKDCGNNNFVLGLSCLVFVLLTSLLVLQLLTGILVEVVNAVSTVEKEQIQVTYVKQKLMSLLDRGIIDDDRSHTISKEEFRGLLTNRDAAVTIKEVGVDVVGLVDFAEIMFGDDVELSIHDFIDFVLQLRGTNTCTVKDIVDLRKFLVGEMQLVENDIGKRLDELKASFADLPRGAGRKRIFTSME